MNTFMEKTLDWLLDKEEQASSNCKIDTKSIDKQIKQVTARKEKYQQEVDKTLHELDHILERLQEIKKKNMSCKEA